MKSGKKKQFFWFPPRSKYFWIPAIIQFLTPLPGLATLADLFYIQSLRNTYWSQLGLCLVYWHLATKRFVYIHLLLHEYTNQRARGYRFHQCVISYLVPYYSKNTREGSNIFIPVLTGSLSVTIPLDINRWWIERYPSKEPLPSNSVHAALAIYVEQVLTFFLLEL